ncbi:MAG: putative porin [Chitinophagaceae bacterium]
MKAILIFLLCIFSFGFVSAQLFSSKNNIINSSEKKIIADTSKKNSTLDDHIFISTFNLQDTSHKSLDTSIRYIHRNPLQNIWQLDLGNFATPSANLLFKNTAPSAMSLGLFANQALLWSAEQVPFFNTTRPYTNLFYKLGAKQEQMIDVQHTQNITPVWNIAVAYRKIGSPGFYKLQKNNHDNAYITSHYHSINKKYDAFFTFAYSKLQQDENGGLLQINYLDDPLFKDRRLIPVVADAIGENKSSINNYYRKAQIQYKHIYSMGRQDSVWSSDSLEKIYTFKPYTGLAHSISYASTLHQYKDLAPDENFYQKLNITDFVKRDSVYNRYYLRRFTNKISLLGALHFREQKLQAEAGYGLDLDQISLWGYKKTYLNNFVFATFTKPALHAKAWQYEANFMFYFTGIALGNTHLHASISKPISAQHLLLQLGFEQKISTAPYQLLYYANNHYQAEQSFSKQSSSRVYAQIKVNPSFYIDGNYYLLANYLYRDTNLIAKQHNALIPLLQLVLHKHVNYKHWILENDIALQYNDKQSPIHIPLWTSTHKLSYENFILKKKLAIASGLEVKWNSPYWADQYSPIVYGFVPQYENKISNFPQCSAFFNFKVKRFRAFIRADQLQQLFISNAIAFPQYAMPNTGLYFGFQWAFIN